MQIFSTVGELPTPSAERLSNRGDLLLIPLIPSILLADFGDDFDDEDLD